MRLSLLVASALVLSASAPGSALAQKLTAERIVEKARERGGVFMMGFDVGVSKVQIILQDSKGNKRVRAVESRVRRKDGDKGDRESVMKFLDPRDVRGVAVLQHEHTGSEDDIYLYLPAFKRTRRIAGNDKSGQFMGTDFSYVDMEDQELGDAKYELGDDVVIDGVKCYMITSTPYSHSQYSKQYSKIEMFIRQDNFLAQQMKYYDRKGKFMKAYRLLETRTIDGRPIVSRSQTWTKRTDHSTFILVDSVDRRTPLSPAEFRPEVLGN